MGRSLLLLALGACNWEYGTLARACIASGGHWLAQGADASPTLPPASCVRPMKPHIIFDTTALVERLPERTK